MKKLVVVALLLLSAIFQTSNINARQSDEHVREIAISYTKSGENPAIWLVNSLGKNVIQLTSPSDNSADLYPSWSPDADKIAFVRISYVESTQQTIANLWLVESVNETWQQERQLTYTGDLIYESPVWSPTQNMLAFRTTSTKLNVNGTNAAYSDVYMYNADAEIITMIEAEFAYKERPVWSLDGTLLNFGCNQTGVTSFESLNPPSDMEICSYSIQNETVENVSKSPSVPSYYPLFLGSQEAHLEIEYDQAENQVLTLVTDEKSTKLDTDSLWALNWNDRASYKNGFLLLPIWDFTNQANVGLAPPDHIIVLFNAATGDRIFTIRGLTEDGVKLEYSILAEPTDDGMYVYFISMGINSERTNFTPSYLFEFSTSTNSVRQVTTVGYSLNSAIRPQ